MSYYASWGNSTSNTSGARIQTVAFMADDQPTIQQDSAGRLTIKWQHESWRPQIRMDPDLLVQIVDQLNELALRRLADNRQDDQ